MTPENKKTLKVIALSVGIILIVAIIVILIVKQLKKREEENEGSEENEISKSSSSITTPNIAVSSGASSAGNSLNTFGGRTFSETEIKKMQGYLYNMGALKYNDKIVSAIRDSGGMDGKIGNGFKTAYNEAIRVGIITNLDFLYTQAMKLM